MARYSLLRGLFALALGGTGSRARPISASGFRSFSAAILGGVPDADDL